MCSLPNIDRKYPSVHSLYCKHGSCVVTGAVDGGGGGGYVSVVYV